MDNFGNTLSLSVCYPDTLFTGSPAWFLSAFTFPSVLLGFWINNSSHLEWAVLSKGTMLGFTAKYCH